MKGKQRCKILKEIRRQIAENNDIEYVTSECKHQGDCPGTCPKCESEVRYLERELEKRQRLGKAVTVAGLAVTMTATTMTATSCDIFESRTTAGDMVAPEEVYEQSDGQIEPPEEDGMIAPPEEELVDGEIVEIGEIPVPEETEESNDDPADTAGDLVPEYDEEAGGVG